MSYKLGYDLPTVRFPYHMSYKLGYDLPKVRFPYHMSYKLGYDLPKVRFPYHMSYKLGYDLPKVRFPYHISYKVGYDILKWDYRTTSTPNDRSQARFLYLRSKPSCDLLKVSILRFFCLTINKLPINYPYKIRFHYLSYKFAVPPPPPPRRKIVPYSVPMMN